jgi:hypothetical protein
VMACFSTSDGRPSQTSVVMSANSMSAGCIDQNEEDDRKSQPEAIESRHELRTPVGGLRAGADGGRRTAAQTGPGGVGFRRGLKREHVRSTGLAVP